MQLIDKHTLSDPELIFDHLGVGVIILDAEGFIQFCNNTIEKITGFSAEDLAGSPFHVFYGGPEESIKVTYELELSAKKGLYRTESWKKRKDAPPFWCEMSICPIRLRGDNTQGFAVSVIDQTARIQGELEIRNREERFRLMVEVVRDYSIFMLDAKGYILTWNEGARRTIGYPSNEIIGKHFSVFYTKADLDDGKPERELKIASEKGRYEEEGWRVRKSGSLFWSSVVITALWNQNNQLIGFSKVTRDLTERREKEDELRQSEERYRSLVEQVTDYGIFMMDERGRIVSWNEGARRINGYEASEIIGQYFTKFYPEEDIINGKPSHELKVAIAEGKYEEEGWRIRKDGTRFWASVVITAVYNAHGVHIGFSKVTKDLSERKEAERALRESYDRYRQLAEQLKVTNAELSHTNQELEQFTSIVSHDLQEPIRTIKSFLHLIEMKAGDQVTPAVGGYIRKSLGGANRMQELIQNLLNYSQLSKNTLVEEPVNTAGIIHEALANLRSAVDISNASVNIDVTCDIVIGDRIQLVQLLQNLLSNALKFSDKKRPEITISCHEENGMAKFAVSDNGIGIDADDLHKVFDIFRRLNTEKDYPGTGIGLAICKKIVERHRGQIWVESKKNIGTTFYFTLRIS